MKLTLPWPDPGLSPNARIHRMVKAKIAKEMRQLGYYTMAERERKGDGLLFRADKLHMSLRFYPPDGRKRDLDNLFASMKPYLDGVFDFLDIDDAQVCVVTLHRDQRQVEAGRVDVEIEAI